MRADDYTHVPMVSSAPIPVLSETPHRGSAAFIWERGAIFGIFLGVILIIISLLPLGALNLIIVILVGLIGFFLIGLLAASQSGRVGTGALVGLVTGLISGLIVALLVVMKIMASVPQITQVLIVDIVIALILIVTPLLGLGAGMGALGGLVGRRQTKPVASTSIADTPWNTPPSAQSQYPLPPGPTQSQE